MFLFLWKISQLVELYLAMSSDVDVILWADVYFLAGVTNLGLSTCSWTTIPIAPHQLAVLAGADGHEHPESLRLLTLSIVEQLVEMEVYAEVQVFNRSQFTAVLMRWLNRLKAYAVSGCWQFLLRPQHHAA